MCVASDVIGCVSCMSVCRLDCRSPACLSDSIINKSSTGNPVLFQILSTFRLFQKQCKEKKIKVYPFSQPQDAVIIANHQDVLWSIIVNILTSVLQVAQGWWCWSVSWSICLSLCSWPSDFYGRGLISLSNPFSFVVCDNACSMYWYFYIQLMFKDWGWE